jgi:hypothetical protein
VPSGRHVIVPALQIPMPSLLGGPE